ncbi:MAG: prepilin-type N-terminal cleavage/methylation domain-containing protein [Gemmatimonadetes bacterium]|uniref:Prepilin-type N-terminal cleavage/methylation domain-containing protein n=1 Tax=Candidatus Kutchimonas denitrificans TaxID=3056748 RepID=A0AAE4ZAF4_9BACT|nr:prepilin-type N-terminal cleavage/methylation domain-containing protein [Gemmatimonadota bacterium]NIR74501.1 prepilin-type N-terminal cleavage/methylation domain-containing protein [Candidatus Kutchimonas denitrificans]NIS02691.1 prepilin-type N-terminal cleavage/methylation domain-containing protein [Gemmatimonadota bacterium]NIT68852.1 prepilin-type N-terminal cleavage/methylation domain-containing protein [Gemmatimonadota bacterium]NIU52157.1 prepilin-type N-terminal cleavage/methylation
MADIAVSDRKTAAPSVRRSATGFTLIELLIVVVLIGLLTAIAIPQFGSAREKAYRAQLQGDLHSLISAQESYFSHYNAYADDVSKLEFNKTPNVTVNITEVAGNGWSAKAVHAATPVECGLYIGNASPPAGIPVTTDGKIVCTE